jgi:hypothetical protein
MSADAISRTSVRIVNKFSGARQDAFSDFPTSALAVPREIKMNLNAIHIGVRQAKSSLVFSLDAISTSRSHSDKKNPL